MDDMNDIRGALGAMRNRLNEVNERVQRIEPIADLAEWASEQLSQLPERVDEITKSIEANPMLSMFAPVLVPQLQALATDIRERRERAETDPAQPDESE